MEGKIAMKMEIKMTIVSFFNKPCFYKIGINFNTFIKIKYKIILFFFRSGLQRTRRRY